MRGSDVSNTREDAADRLGHVRGDARWLDTTPTDHDVPVKTLSTRELDRRVNEELLTTMRLLSKTSSVIAARYNSQVVNNVLETAVWLVGTDGTIIRSFQTQVGSIRFTNLSAGSLTVQSGVGSSGFAPTQGRGMNVIPAGATLSMAIGAHAFTVYGAAAASFNVQAFTGLQAFGVEL